MSACAMVCLHMVWYTLQFSSNYSQARAAHHNATHKFIPAQGMSREKEEKEQVNREKSSEREKFRERPER